MRLALAATALALSGLLASGGCAKKPERVEVGGPLREYQPKEYPKVLDRWTRQGRVLKDLETVLLAHATFLSTDFRSAYSARFIADYRLPPGEAARVRSEAMSDAQAAHEFYIAVATAKPAQNDLEK